MSMFPRHQFAPRCEDCGYVIRTMFGSPQWHLEYDPPEGYCNCDFYERQIKYPPKPKIKACRFYPENQRYNYNYVVETWFCKHPFYPEIVGFGYYPDQAYDAWLKQWCGEWQVLKSKRILPKSYA